MAGPNVKSVVSMKRLAFLTGFLWLRAWGGESAVLESGFRMRIDHHERAGSLIRLYTTTNGFVELPASSVLSIDPDEYIPPPPKTEPALSADSTSQQPAKPKPTAKELVEQAATNNGLPSSILHLVARQESGYRQDAVSPRAPSGSCS